MAKNKLSNAAAHLIHKLSDPTFLKLLFSSLTFTSIRKDAYRFRSHFSFGFHSLSSKQQHLCKLEHCQCLSPNHRCTTSCRKYWVNSKFHELNVELNWHYSVRRCQNDDHSMPWRYRQNQMRLSNSSYSHSWTIHTCSHHHSRRHHDCWSQMWYYWKHSSSMYTDLHRPSKFTESRTHRWWGF